MVIASKDSGVRSREGTRIDANPLVFPKMTRVRHKKCLVFPKTSRGIVVSPYSFEGVTGKWGAGWGKTNSFHHGVHGGHGGKNGTLIGANLR